MSKDNNTNLFTQHNADVIREKLSVDNCKECPDLISCDAGFVCANAAPTTDTCSILRTDFEL